MPQRFDHRGRVRPPDLFNGELDDDVLESTDSPMKARSLKIQEIIRERAQELEAAQGQADDRRRSADVMGGAETINRAFTGGDGGESAFVRSLRTNAAQPVRDLSARYDLERTSKAAADAEATARKQAALDDPDSEDSVQARALFGATEMGRAFVEKLGADNFARVPASRVPGLDSILKKEPDAVGRLADERARRDPSSAISQQTRDAAAVVIQARNPKFYDQVRPQIERASAELVEKMFLPALSAEDKQAFDAERSARAEAARAQRAADAKAAREQTAESKTAAKNAEFFVDGFEIRPDARPRATEVSGLRSATAFNATLRDTVGEIRRLYEQYGTEALPTEARARMAALARDLQLSAKGEELYRLGVLTGPDLSLLEELVPNPAAGKANVLAILGGSDQTLAKLETLLSQAETRLRNRAKSLGYVPEGTTKTPVGGASGRVRVRKGAQTLEIDAGDVTDAEAEGWSRY